MPLFGMILVVTLFAKSAEAVTVTVNLTRTHFSNVPLDNLLHLYHVNLFDTRLVHIHTRYIHRDQPNSREKMRNFTIAVITQK